MKLLVVFFFLISSCAQPHAEKSSLASAWQSHDDPDMMRMNLQYDFTKLPQSGQVAKEPWSASYWPNVGGGIARRWQGKVGAKVKKMDYKRVRRMSFETIARLSSAEKMDIYLSHYNFPLANSEYRKSKGWFTKSWVGMCHGWAPAAIREPLPGASVTMTNRDGIRIKFYQDDIKALLTRSYAYGTENDVFIGSRNTKKDNNAGTLHVILANLVGLRQQSFGIDRDLDKQVWNQPVYSYHSETGTPYPYRGRGGKVAYGTRYLVEVETKLTYVDEHKSGSTIPRPNLFRNLYLKYTLELDASKRIIGGSFAKKYKYELKKSNGQIVIKWGSQRRPDYIFQVVNAPSSNSKGHYKIPYGKVQEILRASLR